MNVLQDDKVFSYYNRTLEKGFPVEIQQVFPGVPSHLDAAVECPKGECTSDSVLFFKGKWMILKSVSLTTVADSLSNEILFLVSIIECECNKEQ